MSLYELELEVCAYEELMAVMSGRKTPLASSQFIKEGKEFVPYTGPLHSVEEAKANADVPVTPAEMGWE